MKIAIPTFDGINIATNLANTKGFLVFTIQFGEIIEEEFRRVVLSGLHSSDNEWITSFDDCSVFIVKELNEQDEDFLKRRWNEVVHTNKTIITRIILDFLNTSLVKESNTLCCP
jgi:hypothetical protein